MEFYEGYNNLVKSPLDFTNDMKFPMPEDIIISDTTLRDGEQSPGVAFTPSQKLDIAKALDNIGVHIIDLGFPAASESEKKAFELILNAKRNGDIKSETELMVTCRAHVSDIDHAFQVLLEHAAKPSDITFFVFSSGSDLHIKYKIGKTLLKREGLSESEWESTPIEFYREANIRMLADIIKLLKSRGAKKIEAGCAEDGSRADVNYLIQMARASIDAGATRIAFADTIGVLIPKSTAFYFAKLRESLPETPIIAHCHDDYGLASINSIIALANGATGITCTVNGIGERAGNAALHSVTAALRDLYGVTIPHFKYQNLNRLSKLVENHSGLPLKVNEPIVGKNVFTHESGIHLAGVIIDRRIYSHVPPETYGGSEHILFGKHSGHNAVEMVLKNNNDIFKQHGITIDDDLINKTLKMVKNIRERNQEEKSSETIIKRYYKVMDMLGISEEKLVELALMIARTRRGF